jgi:hypothetical protein
MANLTVDATVQTTYSAAARAASIGAQKSALLNSFRDSVGTGWKFRVRETGLTVDRILVTGLSGEKIPVVAGKLKFVLADVTVTTVIDTTWAGSTWAGQILDSSNNIIAYGTFGTSGTDFIVSGDLVATSGLNGITVELAADSTLDIGLTEVLAINCGGPAFTASTGLAYVEDVLFSNGTVAAGVSNAIANTTEDTLYQTERYGLFTYTIPVTNNKNYRVVMQMAEIFDAITTAGLRVFSLILQEGTAQEITISNIDVFQSVGQYAALEVTRDVYVTNGAISIRAVAVTQNPKMSALVIRALDGGVYIPPVAGGGGGGSGTTFTTPLATALAFKANSHDAACGLMPAGFSQTVAGRVYTTDYTRVNLSAQLVPWFTAYGAGNKAWPTTIGIEVGYGELWKRTTATGLWTLVHYWNTVTPGAGKQARDDFGYLLNPPDENFGAALPYNEFSRQSSDGTMIFQRRPTATFPTVGTNIHCYWEGPNSVPYGGAGQINFDRSGLSNIMFRCKVRAVAWPASSGLPPSTNPTWDQTSIVFGMGADAWDNGRLYWDLGICQHVYVTNAWKDIYWYSGTTAQFTANPPPGIV